MKVRLNRAALIVESNIFASNGVVHLINSVLTPPPSALGIIQDLPAGEFSMLQHALVHDGLGEELQKMFHSGQAVGSTIFAPDNVAFRSLGI